jgi:NAD(P)-dependent dehydrogenase (short-subunit alcohol dehydrogenase family)
MGIPRRGEASGMSGMRIVITGGGSGLGRALALEYARQDGARVAVLDRDGARAGEVAAAVDEAGGKGLGLACDVCEEDAVEAAARAVRRAWKGVDVLVNNAGVAGSGTVADTTLEDWRRIIDVNLLGAVAVCRAFLPGMIKARAGHVVNVASAAGFVSAPGMAAYNASKAAVISLSESLRAELAPHGIGVTVACPSFFRTRLLEDFRGSDASRQIAMKLMERSPLSAEDIARAIRRGVRRREFMVVPHLDAWGIQLLKRFTPGLFYTVVGKRAAAFLAAHESGSRRP